jgi:hypothetical protein
MKKLTTTLAALYLLGGNLVSVQASAAGCNTGSSGEPTLQDVFNNITVSGASSVNAGSDCLADSADSSWSINGNGLSGVTLVIELAGNASSNTFGIYDVTNSSNMVQLFDGAASQSDQSVLSIKANGAVFVDLVDTGIIFDANNFGYYLGTRSNGTFYSDSSLNADGADHLYAYQGKGDGIQIPGLAAGTWTENQFALAWEDLRASNSKADFDFNDFVVMVDSVAPSAVPVPAAVWLFVSGLLGLVGMARRRRQ